MASSAHRSAATVLVAIVVALAGCQSDRDDVTPSAEASVPPSASSSIEPSEAVSPSATESGEGEDTSVFDIEVGDCFNADSDELASVLVVDCDRPHAYEAFHLFDHEAGPDEAYPGDDVILEYADTNCQAPFEEYVGIDYQTSIWFIASVTPSAETWAEGDREIICTLDQQDQDGVAIEVTGTARGSAE
jgi:hypothetical protein